MNQYLTIFLVIFIGYLSSCAHEGQNRGGQNRGGQKSGKVTYDHITLEVLFLNAGVPSCDRFIRDPNQTQCIDYYSNVFNSRFLEPAYQEITGRLTGLNDQIKSSCSEVEPMDDCKSWKIEIAALNRRLSAIVEVKRILPLLISFYRDRESLKHKRASIDNPNTNNDDYVSIDIEHENANI